jgi:nitroreductase
MDAYKAIMERRSIRKYMGRDISEEMIGQIISAAILAPSSKNRQPWRFVVVKGRDAKAKMLAAMRAGIEREQSIRPVLTHSKQYICGARQTLKIMEQAVVTIFAINPSNKWTHIPSNMEEQFYQLADTQSIGAAIENMMITATELGLGSLWNCDIFFAYEEICEWLRTDEQVVAAISIGYPAESPMQRPRKALHEVVEWM